MIDDRWLLVMGGKSTVAHKGHAANYDLSQVSNKAASSVNKEKLLKEYFHRGYPYAAIVSMLEKRHGERMHVRMLKSKLRIDLEN